MPWMLLFVCCLLFLPFSPWFGRELTIDGFYDAQSFGVGIVSVCRRMEEYGILILPRVLDEIAGMIMDRRDSEYFLR